jgi:hypothetical protein
MRRAATIHGEYVTATSDVAVNFTLRPQVIVYRINMAAEHSKYYDIIMASSVLHVTGINQR